MDDGRVGPARLQAQSGHYVPTSALARKARPSRVHRGAVALIRFKINSTWLILAGGVIGYTGQRMLA